MRPELIMMVVSLHFRVNAISKRHTDVVKDTVKTFGVNCVILIQDSEVTLIEKLMVKDTEKQIKIMSEKKENFYRWND